MNKMTLPSRHRVRNSSPGVLRPSTLPRDHRGYPQYWWIFKSGWGRNTLLLRNLITGASLGGHLGLPLAPPPSPPACRCLSRPFTHQARAAHQWSRLTITPGLIHTEDPYTEPTPGQCWANVTNVRPMLGQRHRRPANAGPMSPTPGQCWANVTNARPMLGQHHQRHRRQAKLTLNPLTL